MGFVRRTQASNTHQRSFLARLAACCLVLMLIIAPAWSQNACETPMSANVGYVLDLYRFLTAVKDVTETQFLGLYIYRYFSPLTFWIIHVPDDYADDDPSLGPWAVPFEAALHGASDTLYGIYDVCNQWLKDVAGLTGNYRNSFPTPRAVPATSAAIPLTGQASQGVLVADFLGNGTPAAITLASNGIEVQLYNSDGSIQSTNQFPTGFAPDLSYSTITAADFNGDGKLDVAISNPGTPDLDSGSVAILLGNGDGTFRAAQSFPAGKNPSSLAAADFNADGKIDLAAASSAGGTIAILSGKGDGTFSAPVSIANGGDSQATPVSIFTLDLNGDGRPDLAVANQGFVTVPNSSISILLNTGTGFRAAFNSPLPQAILPTYLAYADLNNDGKADLVAVSSQASAAVVLFGNGDGTFQAPVFYAAGNYARSVAIVPQQDGSAFLLTPDIVKSSTWVATVTPQGVLGAPVLNMVGGAPTGIAVGDLNGDGQPDAVVTGGSSDVSVLLGQSGGFKAAAGYSLAKPSPMPAAVAIGDLNGDGKPDVVVAGAGQQGDPGVVSVLLGNGNGTLQTPKNTNVNQNAQSIALADLNRDGKLDAVVAAYGSSFTSSDAGGVVVLLGNGDGTFQTPKTLTVTGQHPEAVAVADLNGDRIPDLAAVVVSSNQIGTSTLAIFLGKGDGTFQAAGTFPLKSSGGQFSGIVIGDWNGDGKPDVAAVSQSISAPVATIDVLLGDGAGNFKEVSTLPSTEDGPVNLATADVNRDGVPDLIVAHCCGQGDATYLLGAGDGTFQTEQQLLSGNSPAAVAVTRSGINTTIYSAANGSAAMTAISVAVTANITANGSAASPTITTLAPASIATLYGSNLATGIGSATTSTVPSSLQGTSVAITDSGGAQQDAPLFYVSPGQVNYLVPANTATGAATVTVTSGNGVVGETTSTVANSAPGIFEVNASALAAGIALTVSSDGQQTFQNTYQVTSSNQIVSQPIDVSAGLVYLELYGTGIRNAQTVTVTIGGQSVPVSSSGAQGVFLGLDQVNAGPLPSSLAGKGQANIVLSADGQAANTVNVTFQ